MTSAESNASGESANDDLASLLEASLRAEQDLPGSSASIVRSAPEQQRAELDQLLVLAQRLRSARPGALPLVTRLRLRARIIAEIKRLEL